LGKSEAERIRIFLKGCKTRRSLSPVIIQEAL
jgi:hypothetical protein